MSSFPLNEAWKARTHPAVETIEVDAITSTVSLAINLYLNGDESQPCVEINIFNFNPFHQNIIPAALKRSNASIHPATGSRSSSKPTSFSLCRLICRSMASDPIASN